MITKKKWLPDPQDDTAGFNNIMSQGQIEAIIKDLGITVVSEQETHFSVFCPFHHNTNSSSATVAKRTGYFWCFNGACARKYKLIDLIRKMRGLDIFTAMRFVEDHDTGLAPVEAPVVDLDPDSLPRFDDELLADMIEAYRESPKAQSYMQGRGLNEFTTRDFRVGYDPVLNMICIPMFSIKNECVGIVGRSVEGKSFKNSNGLPSSKTLFNIHEARRHGDGTLIITESAIDAMRVYQTGYKNVVATNGSTFSDFHVAQVYRTFNDVILMTDDDEPGHKFGNRIAKKCKKYGLAVYRAKYDEYNLFPGGVKDACSEGVTDRGLIQCITNADIVI